MPKFTVIGLYLDQTEPQRWASSYDAPDAESAEALAIDEYDPNCDKELTIAGVVAGDVDLLA